MFQRTPYMVTEVGDIDCFAGGNMESIYYEDDRYSNFLEEQVMELKAEENQSF